MTDPDKLHQVVAPECYEEPEPERIDYGFLLPGVRRTSVDWAEIVRQGDAVATADDEDEQPIRSARGVIYGTALAVAVWTIGLLVWAL